MSPAKSSPSPSHLSLAAAGCALLPDMGVAAAAGKGWQPAAVAGDESGSKLPFSLPPLPSGGRLRPLARSGATAAAGKGRRLAAAKGNDSGGEGTGAGCGGGRRVRRWALLLPLPPPLPLAAVATTAVGCR
ncbi:hypothetical protein OsJ_35127 [Oryza sativa Japonica Group]|jgi:hypothetical protein|uniref:Uncharacterized protein n=1 Tax=Oryza sativa subsp. japonica TaxID=39947 RepID=B9GBR0_ORYSJ|nr:hypothetical protein OsJ_35127 [Oryza sativa Japonica Group]